MGLLSLLFGTPAPTQPAPTMSLISTYHLTAIPPDDYTVIDLETSGLNPCNCEILELGAIRYRNNKEVARYHTLIRPEGCIHKSASDVNNITWRKVQNSPSLSQVSCDFLNFLGNDVVVGYNISFDLKFIQTRCGITLENYAFDVLRLVRVAQPCLPSYKLTNVKSYLNVSGESHTAIGDCEATAQIMQICAVLPAAQEHHERVKANQLSQLFFSSENSTAKDFFEYLPANHDFFVEEWTANVVGTSKDYNANTRKTISALTVHENLRFVLSDLPSPDGFCVKVLTQSGIQIGWFADNCWFGEELRHQLAFGVDISVKCLEHGIVAGTDIPWCRLLVAINIPYPANERCVYTAKTGKLYHNKNGCSKAVYRKVPLSYALRELRTPCSKCCQTEDGTPID